VTSTGLGDVSVFVKQVLVQIDDLQETFRILGKASLKFPTGNKNLTPALGTGSWDFSFGTVAGWIGKRFGLYGDVSYSFNGTSEDYSYGNTFSYNVAIGFRLSPAVYETYPLTQWNLYLEALGKYAAKDAVNGVANENSGGHTLFLAPGLQWIPSRVFLAEVSLQFPALQSLNGTQLGTDIGLVAGIRLLLY
ncbi:MAG: transporter, partial [Bacteroidota bacterium]